MLQQRLEGRVHFRHCRYAPRAFMCGYLTAKTSLLNMVASITYHCHFLTPSSAYTANFFTTHGEGAEESPAAHYIQQKILWRRLHLNKEKPLQHSSAVHATITPKLLGTDIANIKDRFVTNGAQLDMQQLWQRPGASATAPAIKDAICRMKENIEGSAPSRRKSATPGYEKNERSSGTLLAYNNLIY